MAISQISLNSLAATTAYVSPVGKIEPTAAATQQQTQQNAQKTLQNTQTDTVVISQQALQKVNENNAQAPGYSPQSSKPQYAFAGGD